MDYPLKKLEYDGTIMLRDYSVEDCVKKNENMRIILSNEVMTLSPEDLVTKFVSRPSQVHESKFENGEEIFFITTKSRCSLVCC